MSCVFAAPFSSPPQFERLQCMERLRNAPSDWPGGRPVASAAVSGLMPSPAALRASHPIRAEAPPRGPRPPRPSRGPSLRSGARYRSQAAAAPATGPPGPRQRPPGLTPCMLASPRLAAARGPLTRPPTRSHTHPISVDAIN